MANIELILSRLNPQQKKAVKYTEGPLLVFAGAGSGKTRVITNRIAYLISEKSVDPSNILAVTFTKKAAGEMKERVEQILKDLRLQSDSQSTIGTFHSIGAMILRQNAKNVGMTPNFSIYDSIDSENLIKDLLKERNMDTKEIKPKSIANFISTAKNELISPEQFPLHYGGFIEDIVADIYPEYQKQLKAQNSVDFGDLLYLTVKMLNDQKEVLEKYQERYKYIMIDEYQDTNAVQYKFVKLLSDKYKNICVVGDDDQGIYAWRGADIKNIQSFEKDFGNVQVIKLEQNYRSTKNVIEAAVSVIGQNNTRISKELWTDKGKGDEITIYQARDQEEEAEYVVDEIAELQKRDIGLSDIAILYRTNYQSRVIEEELLRNGLPYKLVGGFRFYDRQEIKDILSYLKYVVNLKDELSLTRIINVPSRKLGPKSLAALHGIARKVECTLGELLLAAFLFTHPEYENQIKFKKSLILKVGQHIEEMSKYQNVYITFGRIYVDSKDTDALESIETVLRQTRYVEYIDDGTEQAQYKKENIEELKNVASSYVAKYGKKSLEIFLQEIALIEQEQDKNQDGSGQNIHMMTLHSSKGLEFPYVFIIGMEEGLLPHSRSFTDEEELEEERRLCYVGITRAKEKLYLTFAERRQTREGYSNQIPSRFLGEIPQDICDYYSWQS
ncbi:MAG: UvrD-helicase domain-containing protein [Candidatus Dojkabacteria bacterium]|nr:UvrD-helicase domain-containing protein [Candidatus Dojkabacteria bacterium]